MTLEERFWDKVVMGYGGECFEWAGAKTTAGYGELFVRKVKGNPIFVYAHRYAWELANGPIPEGMHVCHKCDRPSCCNSAHLFLGTHKENIQDAFRKGRMEGRRLRDPRLTQRDIENHARGEAAGGCKLAGRQVEEVRAWDGKAPSTEVARLFSLHSSTVRRIWHRQTWTHIALIAVCFLNACARTDIFWPSNGKDVVVDDHGRPHRPHGRAIVLNGTDSLGATHIRITANSLEFSNQGGLDNSTSTREGYRTARYGAGAAVTAVLGVTAINAASSAYGANQAQVASSNASAAKVGVANAAAKGSASKLPQVGSTIPAQTQATVTVPTTPAVVPAAGSTIPATIPATVVPVPVP